MQRAPGEQAKRAGDIVAAGTRGDRIEWFYRLGRLWIFDVLINNADRFYAGNWGNSSSVRVGSCSESIR